MQIFADSSVIYIYIYIYIYIKLILHVIKERLILSLWL